MIIQCEKCLTKFKVNDNLIKGSDAKLRCSRCSHVFILHVQKGIGQERQDIEPNVGDTIEMQEEKIGSVAGGEWDFSDKFEEEDMEDIDGLEAGFEKGTSQSSSSEMDMDVEIVEDQSDDDLIEEEFIEEKHIEEEQLGEEIEEVDIEEDRFDEEAQTEAESAKSVSKEQPSKKSHGLLYAFLIILILIGLGYSANRWGLDLISQMLAIPPLETNSEQPAIDMGGNRLKILTVDHSFVNSKTLGRLFLIQGKVVNEYPKSRSYLQVKGSILDDEGKVIHEKVVYAGNPFVKEDLAEMSMEEIDRFMNNQVGIDNANLNVEPGTSIDYAIVFKDLPENMSQCQMEPFSSSPDEDEW